MTGPLPDRHRRVFLFKLFSLGALGAVGLPEVIREAMAMGQLKYPSGMQKVVGDVRINGQPVGEGAAVNPGDIVTTGVDSQAVFVVGEAVYLLRAGARLELVGETPEAAREKITRVLRVLNGRMLAVFGGGRKRIETPTAVAGIRGSGVYVDADPHRTYLCTCYGEAEIVASAAPEQKETIRTRHHEAPRYIHAAGAGALITPAPVIDHTDAELIMLEAIMWRKPPFAGSSGGY